jgi:3-oxoacyl-[acyl-carrier-protein] synthase II
MKNSRKTGYRIFYFLLTLTALCFAVTACASSPNSIGEAFRAIKFGYADAIIAGGSEATIHALPIAGFTNCMALSKKNLPDETSVPFDIRRDGFVMGEGGGALILEEYEHAKKRDAKIYAEIAGYGNTCDAHHVTAPSPDGSGTARAITDALKEAGISGDNLYINAHGTSTPLNDKSETIAIKLALQEKAKTALVSSTKSMIGHCLGAAGVLEAITVIKALETGIVPPTIGYKEPDPECDLDYVPNKAQYGEVKAAASGSLGFGGHNAVVVFKKY